MTSGDQSNLDAQTAHVAGTPCANDDDQARTDTPIGRVSSFALDLAAATLDDIQSVRLATASRILAAERNGLPTEQFVAMLDMLVAVEHQAELDLKRVIRKHPFGPWIKATIGIGETRGGRLLSAIGDPYWNHAENRARRGPAELWAYCGYKPGQRRTKGVKSNWNAEAKMRAYLCAESCMTQRRSPYRVVYDNARAAWVERDTTDLHKHNHALRLVAKEILKDLWREGRRLHGNEAA